VTGYWYVASFVDGDTHLGEPTSGEHLVTARYDGRRFRPLAALSGTPPDQTQVCPAFGQTIAVRKTPRNADDPVSAYHARGCVRRVPVRLVRRLAEF
jgi:hypothetical protein